MRRHTRDGSMATTPVTVAAEPGVQREPQVPISVAEHLLAAGPLGLRARTEPGARGLRARPERRLADGVADRVVRALKVVARIEEVVATLVGHHARALDV